MINKIVAKALSLAQWMECTSTFLGQIFPEVCADNVRIPASFFSVVVSLCTGDWTVVLDLLELLGVDHKAFKAIVVAFTVINAGICFYTGDYIGGIKQLLLIDWRTLWSVLIDLQKFLKKEWPI